MPILFPSNPTVNQVYTVNGQVWSYNGKGWTKISSSVSVSTTAPVSPVEGSFWVNSESGDLYVYASGGWVVVSGSAGAPGAPGASVNAVVNSYVWFTG